MYQSATIVVPSGFMSGTRSRMTLSRMARISSDSSVTALNASREAACAGATSDECRPKSIQTTALPSRVSARA